MSDDVQILSLVAMCAASIAGVGHSIAAIIRETYRGKALLIEARKDRPLVTLHGPPEPDPPLPDVVPFVERILRLVPPRRVK